MGAQLSTRLTLEGGAQHNEALRGAASELSKYRREVRETDKELKRLKSQSQTAIGSIQAFGSSLKSGNIDGMLLSGASAAKMFTKSMLGIAGIATAGFSLGSWLSDAVQQGTELAKQGEGIRIAFERINTPGLLDNLREATHNTVTDLELMKQAVKFNDFNLDIQQMGTLLAFAQQKAKDTGQSVDYMVDSIVTGLGRQSLQILDNLGISAAEVKAQMKGGGDMTKAVAEIIKKKMQESGDYVETAADRAKKKEVEISNALEKMGQNFQAGQSAAGDFFHQIELGAINALKWVGTLLNELTEVGRQMNQYNKLGGSDRVTNQVEAHRNAKDPEQYKKTVLAQYDAQIKQREDVLRKLDAWRKGSRSEEDRKAFDASEKLGVSRGDQAAVRAQAEALKQQRAEFLRRIVTPVKATPTPVVDDKKKKTGKKEEVFEKGSIGYIDKEIEKLEKKYKHATTESLRNSLKAQIKSLQDLKNELINPAGVAIPDIPEEYKQMAANINKVLEAYKVGAIGSDKAKELVAGFNTEISKLGLKPIRVKIDTEVIQEARELTDQINDVIEAYNIGAVGYDKANELIAAINKQLKDIGLRPVKVQLQPEIVQKGNDLHAAINDVMQQYDMGAIGYEKAKELIDGFNNQLQSAGLRPLNVQIDTEAVVKARELMTNIDRVIEQHDMGAISTKKARELINGINNEIKNLGLEPIRVDIEPKGLTKMKKLNSDVSTFIGGFEGIDNVKNNIEGLVDSFSEGANAWDIFMGVMKTGQSILQAVESAMAAVNVIQQLLGKTATTTAAETSAAGAAEMATAAEVTTAKSGEAVASATAEGAKMPFPLNIVAIAMGVAAVIAALGMITGAFAGGGIVGGSSYSGDRLYARVNSGEMILNGRQQRNLFNAINSGAIGGGAALGGKVEFIVKGRKLVGVLHNEDDKMNKVK